MSRPTSRRTLGAGIAAALVMGSVLGFNAFRQKASPRAVAREIRWADLRPKEWDPTRRYRAMNLDALRDGDPRTNQLLLDMQATWDNAPTVGALDGVVVKLAGYVVPLEGGKAALTEFLLVPYFGACVHSPPPPANQIIHVVAARPVPGLHTMDSVWVSGTVTTRRQGSIMGASGYRIDATAVQLVETRP